MENGYLDLYAEKRILVVEEEYFLSDETRQMLDRLRALVVGPASNLAEAFAIIDEQNFEAAVLDVHLADELIFPVAERLEELGIPFVFATGHQATLVSRKYSGFVFCEKLNELDKIAKALFASSLTEEMH